MEPRKTLKDLIQDAQLSYRELAQKMGVNHTQIAVWCRPGANPTLKTLVKLAKELKVDLNDLALAFGEDPRGDDHSSED